ncbi:hypothetical protein RRG08_003752 [Elysia crispata]|uniref:Uncharacterized protein n=1 Tax=Elysia crispata TaxID=231223 RepID=A0AAE1AVN6_9GAST|nr:hypothetical protein RRG08_003752 [Elysia crispata]
MGFVVLIELIRDKKFNDQYCISSICYNRASHRYPTHNSKIPGLNTDTSTASTECFPLTHGLWFHSTGRHATVCADPHWLVDSVTLSSLAPRHCVQTR